jgi:hypothetical protein
MGGFLPGPTISLQDREIIAFGVPLSQLPPTPCLTKARKKARELTASFLTCFHCSLCFSLFPASSAALISLQKIRAIHLSKETALGTRFGEVVCFERVTIDGVRRPSARLTSERVANVATSMACPSAHNHMVPFTSFRLCP